MAEKERGRREGDPIPNVVLADNAGFISQPIDLQVARLIRRCAIKASIAATLAPLVFGEVSR
jgi:hypothetical protein